MAHDLRLVAPDYKAAPGEITIEAERLPTIESLHDPGYLSTVAAAKTAAENERAKVIEEFNKADSISKLKAVLAKILALEVPK